MTRQPDGTGSVRVLVVDDNRIIRDSVMLAVQRLNQRRAPGERQVRLLEAEDGATAWDRITDMKVDLVIADLYIPVLSGLKLIEKIRETKETQSVKVLVISASIDDARAASLAAGADQFLQKPIRLVDLVDAMASLLRIASK